MNTYINILCLIGISSCPSGVDPSQITGKYLPWFELVAITGIIFAAVQFMESAKLRFYIFRWGILKSFTGWIMLTSLCLVVLANILPSIPGKPLLLLGYPTTYEVVSLTLISVLIGMFAAYILSPRIFMPQYRPKLLRWIEAEIRYSTDKQSMAAIATIVYHHLEKLISLASQIDRYSTLKPERQEITNSGSNPPQNTKVLWLNSKIKIWQFFNQIKAILPNSRERRMANYEIAQWFINVVLSHPNFIKYISANDIGFILQFVKLTKQYELWESKSGGPFFKYLCQELFIDDKSLLTRELSYQGTEGVYKPISNEIFNSPGIISGFDVFGSFFYYSSDLSDLTIEKWVYGLEMALKSYYSSPQTIRYAYSPNWTIGRSIENLVKLFSLITSKIRSLEGDSVWGNPQSNRVHTIVRFLNEVEFILCPSDPDDPYKPNIGPEELNCEKYTVSESIAKALFEYFDALTTFKNENYARSLAFDLHWITNDFNTVPIIVSIRNKLLELMNERIDENLKNWYPSMIKLLLDMYGYNWGNGESRGQIEKLIRQRFDQEIASKIISDVNFRERHMPSDWKIHGGWKQIRNHNGDLIFQMKKNKDKK